MLIHSTNHNRIPHSIFNVLPELMGFLWRYKYFNLRTFYKALNVPIQRATTYLKFLGQYAIVKPNPDPGPQYVRTEDENLLRDFESSLKSNMRANSYDPKKTPTLIFQAIVFAKALATIPEGMAIPEAKDKLGQSYYAIMDSLRGRIIAKEGRLYAMPF